MTRINGQSITAKDLRAGDLIRATADSGDSAEGEVKKVEGLWVSTKNFTFYDGHWNFTLIKGAIKPLPANDGAIIQTLNSQGEPTQHIYKRFSGAWYTFASISPVSDGAFDHLTWREVKVVEA